MNKKHNIIYMKMTGIFLLMAFVLLSGCLDRNIEYDLKINTVTLSNNQIKTQESSEWITVNYYSNANISTVVYGIDTEQYGIVQISKGNNSFDILVPSTVHLGRNGVTWNNVIILYDPTDNRLPKWSYMVDLYSIGVRVSTNR